MSFRLKKKQVLLCRSCGQFHELGGNHLFDYCEAVDDDLTCQICLQPYVCPMDTPCGHTYCAKCLKCVVRLKGICPIDRLPITKMQCRQSSIMVQRILDKLNVTCPNTTYCSLSMPRCDLEAHLLHRCQGMMTACKWTPRGCTYKVPRVMMPQHTNECPFREIKNPSQQIIPGVVSYVDIERLPGYEELGISIIGGADTALLSVMVQEVFSNGLVARDGRIVPGDHLLEINGDDLRSIVHMEARKLLAKHLHSPSPSIKLKIYREKIEECPKSLEEEEVVQISLTKLSGVQLGIKIVGKKKEAGVFILGLVEDSAASLDGKLRADDRILKINEDDLTEATPEKAKQIIQCSKGQLDFTVLRKTVRTDLDTVHDQLSTAACSSMLATGMSAHHPPLDQPPPLPPSPTERLFVVQKAANESLGITVSGGMHSHRGNLPVYISDIQPNGCLGKDRQLKRGDIILSINGNSLTRLTHTESVGVLKACASSKVVSLKVIRGHQTVEGAVSFTPNWITWIQLPKYCQYPAQVTVEKKAAEGSLGFSIAGGVGVVETPQGGRQCPQPVYVKLVVPGGPAQQAQLRCGDIILAVNSRSLEDASHAAAVAILKQATGKVTLTVLSWPGSYH